MPSTPIPKPKLSKASRKNKSERSNVDNTNNDMIIGSLMESAPNMRQAAMPTSPSNALPGPDSPLIGPLSDLRAPATLLSAALPANLVEDGHSFSGGLFDDNDLNTMVASRPRTLWTIQDTALRSIPKNYPPLNRNCTAYVGDASPSVVAVRVAECLRKRSIAVEYDDESVSSVHWPTRRIDTISRVPEECTHVDTCSLRCVACLKYSAFVCSIGHSNLSDS